MATATTTTAPTPTTPGRWVIPRFGPPSVLTWQTFKDGAPSTPLDPDRLTSLPSAPTGNYTVVRIITAGAGGADNIQRAGGYPNPRCKEPGFSPGYEFVGDIVALGPDASTAYANDVGDASASLQVGDRVASMCRFGAYATHTLIPATELVKIPASDDPVDVAALPLNYMTGYGMLRRSAAQLPPGSSVLIGSASGGVGTAIAQLVKAFDMQITMFGTCSAPKMDYVRSLGMTPIDRNASDIAGEVRRLNGGQPVDASFDAVGSVESLEASRNAAKNGTVVMIGVMGEIKADGSGMRNPGATAQEIVGPRLKEGTSFFGVDLQYYVNTKQLWRNDFNDVLAKVREGTLKPQIMKLFKLSDAVHVNEMLAHGSGVQGKMVYVVDGALAKEKGL